MRVALLLLGLALMTISGQQTALADEDKKWICVAEASTGFAYRDGKWVTISYNVDTSRYLVSKKPLWGGLRYEIVPFGEESGTVCELDSPNAGGWIHCNQGFVIFKINITHLRYLSVYMFGYADGDKKGNTPFIERGTCSPI